MRIVVAVIFLLLAFAMIAETSYFDEAPVAATEGRYEEVRYRREGCPGCHRSSFQI